MVKLVAEFTLFDVLSLLAIGFGTASLKGHGGVNAITHAIHNGYRLLDSAFNYENEGAVGDAVRRSDVPREALKVTAKLPVRHHAYDQDVTTIQESLYRAN